LNVIGFVVTSAASPEELEKKFTQKVGGAMIPKVSDSLVSELYIDKIFVRIP